MVYLTEMTRWSLKWMLIVTNETENSQKQASAAWMADTVCSSPSLFALNSTSEQWSINMLSKWHTATLSLKHCHPVIWISTNICSALYSTKRSAWNAGHHGLDFTWTNAFFCKDMCQKWFLHFCPHWLWSVTFWLLCQLFFMLVTSPESLNIEGCSFLELMVVTGQIDRQADGWM